MKRNGEWLVWFGLVVGHILTNSTFWMKPKTSGPLISSSNRRKTKQKHVCIY